MDFILYQEIDILSNNIILEGDNNYRNQYGDIKNYPVDSAFNTNNR